jgi:hypothetical protein
MAARTANYGSFHAMSFSPVAATSSFRPISANPAGQLNQLQGVPGTGAPAGEAAPGRKKISAGQELRGCNGIDDTRRAKPPSLNHPALSPGRFSGRGSSFWLALWRSAQRCCGLICRLLAIVGATAPGAWNLGVAGMFPKRGVVCCLCVNEVKAGCADLNGRHPAFLILCRSPDCRGGRFRRGH